MIKKNIYIWQVTGDMWQVTGDTWHVTRDTWHMTHSVGRTFSQNFGCLALKQCSDVWALSRSKPTFFWKNQLELIFHVRLSKTYTFNFFMTKPLRKKKFEKILDFCGSYFQFLLWNWVFWTNMESNAAVTLHFEDLAVQNYLFLKYVCICWWKISNCLQKHFWWMWSFSF